MTRSPVAMQRELRRLLDLDVTDKQMALFVVGARAALRWALREAGAERPSEGWAPGVYDERSKR